jgi:hypothetical protein
MRTKQAELKQPQGPINMPNSIFPTSRGKAIKLFCCKCMGFTGRKEDGSASYGESSSLVKTCESIDCPLWLYRKSHRNNIIKGKEITLSQWINQYFK